MTQTEEATSKDWVPQDLSGQFSEYHDMIDAEETSIVKHFEEKYPGVSIGPEDRDSIQVNLSKTELSNDDRRRVFQEVVRTYEEISFYNKDLWGFSAYPDEIDEMDELED